MWRVGSRAVGRGADRLEEAWVVEAGVPVCVSQSAVGRVGRRGSASGAATRSRVTSDVNQPRTTANQLKHCELRPMSCAARLWPLQGFFLEQRQILTRQISVHTGKFLEDFRKHGRAVPAPSRSPHRQIFERFFPNLMAESRARGWGGVREYPYLAQSDVGGARRSATSRSLRAFYAPSHLQQCGPPRRARSR